ncbi:MAG TPA: FtsX-like permease family protein [Acidimicrobiales bacterium]|nr:FtsX-like permease family protein [Acidimicrobiales bacterium]
MSTVGRADRIVRGLEWAVGLLLLAGVLATGLVPPAVLVLSIPFLVVAARKPVLRRLAVRNATRRPRETALILLGALLGTAIITGSATVGDTFGNSIRQGAFTRLGPIDQLVRTSAAADRPAIVAAIESVPQEDIDGILPITTIGASIATTAAGDARRAEPNATVLEVDFPAARAFGGDPEATGIAGDTPTAGRAAIGEDLARDLRVEPGDAVVVFAYGASRTFTVDRTLPRRGVAGFALGFGSRSPTLFVAPGTVAELAAASPGTGSPPNSVVAVSQRGGVLEGAERTDAVSSVLVPALAATGLQAQTEPVKQDLLDAAESQGRNFTQLFTAFGTFSALAGILLLISIFVMLAEERKTELGMLRAVGLKRAGLVGTFCLEGWMYALAASALGTIAGIGVGRAIVGVTSGIFEGGGRFTLDLQFTASRSSIHQGFFVGFVFSMLTVLATSAWISRMNVIRAIRDLPEPTLVRQRLGTVVAGAAVVLVGGLLTTSGLAGPTPAALLVGPPLVAMGVAIVVRRWLPKRSVDTVAALAGLLWATLCFDIARDVFRNPDIFLFVLDGVVLTIAGVVLVSRHQSLIGRAVRRLGGGARNMSLRLGLAYPLAKAFRTSLILSTFTLVMFTLVTITLFSGIFGQQIDDFTRDVSGGFDGQAFSNDSNPAPVDAIAEVEGVALVAPLATVGAQFDVPTLRDEPNVPKFAFWPLGGYDAAFVEGGPPKLGEYLPEFGSEDEVWRAVLVDPSLVIVDEFFLQQGGGPPEASVKLGQAMTVRDPVTGTTRDLRVVALAGLGFGQAPAYAGIEAVRSLAGDRAVTNLLRFRVDPGVDPQVVAERLDGAFVENGLSASSFRQQVAEALSQQQQFFRLMQGYLSLGLVVSVAGIGVVMVRAVRERRREVGVLRSLGFETRQVRRAFVAESSFVALEGILLGTGLALISTWRLMTSGAFGEGLEFSVPFAQLLVIVSLAFLATLAATASPAQQASKIRPAVALRIAD